jgi:hypothetical protein
MNIDVVVHHDDVAAEVGAGSALAGVMDSFLIGRNELRPYSFYSDNSTAARCMTP